jgi:hypothetical protein
MQQYSGLCSNNTCVSWSVIYQPIKLLWLDLLANQNALFFQSLVGVCGGATRAALTQHQARRDNMADVSAKDGSQV